jgi:chromosome segregation ATPase
MKQIISKEDVGKAITDLTAQGKKPTLLAIHSALNHRGSMSTVVRLKAEIEAAAQPITDSPQGMEAFREVWALAVEEGRKQKEEKLAELRENLDALAAENERLEGAAMAAQSRTTEAEQAKSRAEAELHQFRIGVEAELKLARKDQAEANTLAADALRKLAEAQAAHTTRVAALQANLTDADRKAHEFELRLVRAEATLAAQAIQPATDELRKSKDTNKTPDKT